MNSNIPNWRKLAIRRQWIIDKQDEKIARLQAQLRDSAQQHSEAPQKPSHAATRETP